MRAATSLVVMALALMLGGCGPKGTVKVPYEVRAVFLVGPAEIHYGQTASYKVKVEIDRRGDNQSTFGQQYVLLRQVGTTTYLMRQRLTFGPGVSSQEVTFQLTSTHPEPPPHMPPVPDTVHYRNEAGNVVNTLLGSRIYPPPPPPGLPEAPPLDTPLKIEAYFLPMPSPDQISVVCVR